MHLGNWQLDTINGGKFRLDGGVMFGVVPRTIWKSVAPPDKLNRIKCANNCVLARDGSHTVLIDTGYGGKFAPLDRRFYTMEEGSPLLDGLAELGVAPEEIDTVVFSHLHFDHVCGATRLDSDGKRVPIFTRARHIVGRTEWEDATSGCRSWKRRIRCRTFCRCMKPASCWSSMTAKQSSLDCAGRLPEGIRVGTWRCSSSLAGRLPHTWATFVLRLPTYDGCGIWPTTLIRSIPGGASLNTSPGQPTRSGGSCGITTRAWGPAGCCAIPNGNSSQSTAARKHKTRSRRFRLFRKFHLTIRNYPVPASYSFTPC